MVSLERVPDSPPANNEPEAPGQAIGYDSALQWPTSQYEVESGAGPDTPPAEVPEDDGGASING